MLGAKLRVSNLDGSEGAVQEMERIVGQLRAKWPKLRITLRADSSFAREALMKWCEEHRVDYVFGLARNRCLEGALESELEQAQALQQANGSSARVYKDFRYQTRKSWSQERRGWARPSTRVRDPIPALSSPRWERSGGPPKSCTRTSTHRMKSNQLRLWFSSVAYNLLHTLRCVALKGTQWAKAQCQTIRLKLLKIGGQISGQCPTGELVAERGLSLPNTSTPKPWPSFNSSAERRQTGNPNHLQLRRLRCV